MLWVLAAPLLALAPPVVHHDLQVTLNPAAGTVEVTDAVTLPAAWVGRPFALHRDLTVEGGTPAEVPGRFKGSLDHAPASGLFKGWASSTEKFTVKYAGKIRIPPEQEPEEYARSFQRTPGTIQAEGVYLTAAVGWIPRFGDELFTFSMSVRGLPAGWSTVSEGTEGKGTWTQSDPVDDVHLIAGPFWRKAERFGKVNAIALLRSEDPALASRYLSVTGRYLAMYEDLIGPYPYDKFAVVENFWETGYGMPSFTLLGPQVIRFPFILHSSYPHELLHNWWGNSVFLDDDSGNWCEGLTAYLADHLVAEQRGQGAEHRRRILSRYRDFATDASDFPLRDFRSRSSPVSEAVGYGKWAMVVHMLRVELGDEKFKAALRAFFKDNLFKRAGFDDLRAAFEAQAGRSLASEFSAWVDNTGAPVIRWSDTRVSRSPAGAWAIELTLEQAQSGIVFPMTVPARVELEGGTSTWLDVKFTNQPLASARASVKRRPVQIDIDPRFDTFRRLDTRETPPTLSVALGSERALMVLPTFASKKETAAWRTFAKQVCKPGACELVVDNDVWTLPSDRAVWVLGYGNSLRAAAIVGAGRYGAKYDDNGHTLEGEKGSNGERSLMMTFRHPRDPARAIVFVGADKTEAIAGLARKLPHYGKYSFLAFKGEAPDNVVKGTWPTLGSPMRLPLVGAARDVRVRPSKALAELPPPFDGARMKATVDALAGPKANGRGLGTPGLAWAERWTEGALKAVGLAVTRQCFDAEGKSACNLVVTVPGSDPSAAPVVLGAHLDHLGPGFPGANDNASGVAVVVEVARALAAEGPYTRPLQLVLFSGEEAGILGSRHFVEQLKGKPVFAMVNLDTVGRAGERPFLVLGHESASEWVHIFRGIGFVSGVKSKMGAEGIAASDHLAFINAGVPAVHLFAGPDPDYHKPGDTSAKVEVGSLLSAAILAKETVTYLAGRTEPLTVRGAKTASTPPGKSRKVSLGTIPDFAFKGPGVRITGVTKGSPAEQAGLQAGDVLLAVGERETPNLRGLADALREAKAGEKMKVRFMRAGEEKSAEVTLVAR